MSYKTNIDTFVFNIGMRNLWKMRRLGTLLSRLGGRHQIVHLKTVSSTFSSGLFFGTSATVNGVVSWNWYIFLMPHSCFFFLQFLLSVLPLILDFFN
jgi:hypothetical protein